MSEQRVCKAHCEHDLRWMHKGVCMHFLVGTGKLQPTCGHNCSFEPSEVGAEHDHSVECYTVGGVLDCEVDNLPDAVPQSEAQHEPSFSEHIALAVEEESQLPDPITELATSIFDYGCSVDWGKGDAVMAQFEIEAIVRKWVDDAEHVRQVMRDAVSAHQLPPSSGDTAPQFGSAKGKVEMAADFDAPEVLSVEQALAELRKMFPDERTIEVREDANARYWADWPGPDKEGKYSYGLVSIGEQQFRGATLDEAMARVRAWKDQQNG